MAPHPQPRSGATARTATLAAAAAALVGSAGAATTTINIGGLTQPTSFAWDEAGRVYISEKEGRIKIAPSFGATSALPLVDLRAQVTSYGEGDGQLAPDVSPRWAA